MPFLDGFAQGFNSTFSTSMGYVSDRRRAQEQGAHWRAEEDIARRQEERAAAREPYEIGALEAQAKQALAAAGYNDAITREAEERIPWIAQKAQADIRSTNASADEAIQRALKDEIANQSSRLEQSKIIDWFRRSRPGITDEEVLKIMAGEALPPPGRGTPTAAIPETAPGETEPEAPTPPPEDISTAAGEVPYLAGTGGETAEVPGTEPLSSAPDRGVMEHITGRRGDAGRRAAIPPDGSLAAAPVTGRTLQDYLAMSRQELAQLPPEEYNRFVDMYEAAENPAYTTPARTPTTRPAAGAPARTPTTRPAAGAPAAASTARVPQARPAPPGATSAIDPRLPRRHPGYPARVPQARPEYTEQQPDYGTARVPRPRPNTPAVTLDMPAFSPVTGDMAQGMAIQQNVRPGDRADARAIQENVRPPSDVDLTRDIQGVRDEAQIAGAQNIRDEATRERDIAGAQGLRGEVIEAQAGTRNKPLNTRTRSMLEAASAATGLQVRVTSGAQPSTGSNRTGSHRHDTEVGAGDIQLIDPQQNNKVLSFEVAEDRERMLEFMRVAKENGATGFGAGLDYMGPTTLHVGFGSPAIWGAGGKKENAPEWLVAGLMGAPQGAIPASGGQPRIAGNEVFNALGTRLPFLQAAILAGSIQQESSGNPNALNEAEGAHGIIQWRDSRWADLQKFAGEKGGDPNSLQTQIDFLLEEGSEGTEYGTGQDKAAWAKFMAAKTPEEANAALKGFIRWGEEGNRLQYGKELLSQATGGGPATTGSIGRGGRTPTDVEMARGTGPGIDRAFLRQSSMDAAKAGMNYNVQNAGLTGPTPAITDQGRVQNQKQYLTGAGAASPQEVAAAKEVVQKTLSMDDKLSEGELNSLTLATSYDYYLNVKGDAKAAQATAGELLQAFRQKHNQYMGFAQTLANGGQLDKAMQMAAKAYAQIPDGKDAKFTWDGDSVVATVTDYEGNVISEDVYSAKEIYAGIMGWSPIDFDKRLMIAAGEEVPSPAYEAYSAASAGIPETGAPAGTPPGSVDTENLMEQTVAEMRGATRSPVGGEAPPVPDVAAMTTKEAPLALKQSEISNKRRDELRTATFGTPFTDAQRKETDLQLADAASKMPDQMAAIATLFPDQPQKINTIVYGIQQMNPNVPVQQIIGDLAIMAQGSNNFELVGQTSETRSTQVPDSVVLNMPNNIFSMIWNPLMRKEAAGGAPPPTAARDADTAQEKIDAQRAADEARARITPSYNPRGGRPNVVPTPPETYTPAPLFPSQPTFNPRAAIPQSTTPPSGYINKRGRR